MMPLRMHSARVFEDMPNGTKLGRLTSMSLRKVEIGVPIEGWVYNTMIEVQVPPETVSVVQQWLEQDTEVTVGLLREHNLEPRRLDRDSIVKYNK